MSKIKVSVVSYLNSKVFIKGLIPNAEKDFDISLDIPSKCAEKLISKKVDIGLIPVAVIPQIEDSEIISDYCISAHSSVNSVFLFSNSELKDIHTIYLDPHSRTSNLLCRILAAEFWNIDAEFIPRTDDQLILKPGEAFVLIGDRTFEKIGMYKTQKDLSEEWFHYSGLDFVFAAWVSNKKLTSSDKDKFNEFLKNGFNFLSEVIEENKLSYFDVNDYLRNKVQYQLNDSKREAIKLFLEKSVLYT